MILSLNELLRKVRKTNSFIATRLAKNKLKLIVFALLCTISTYGQRMSDIEDYDTYEPTSDEEYIFWFVAIIIIFAILFIYGRFIKKNDDD